MKRMLRKPNVIKDKLWIDPTTNKTEVLVNDSNYTENVTDSTSIKKASITGIVKAISLSWLDIVLLFWIITLIIDEIQQENLNAWLKFLLILFFYWLFRYRYRKSANRLLEAIKRFF